MPGGLFRTEYEGKTLCENLGLARPENRYAASHQERKAALDGSGHRGTQTLCEP